MSKVAHASKRTSEEWVSWAHNQGWKDIGASEEAGKVSLLAFWWLCALVYAGVLQSLLQNHPDTNGLFEEALPRISK